MLKTNYHTHTYRCKHAMGSDERIVKAAIESKTDILGFSDHCPWNWFPKEYDSYARMEPEFFPEYCRSIRKLRDKYRDQIELHLGIEAEYYPNHMQELRELVAEHGIEYVIMGGHSDELNPIDNPEAYYFGRDCVDAQGLMRYAENVIGAIESGFFAYIGHPDLFMRGYPDFDADCAKASRMICEAAAKHHCILEYNVSGFELAREQGRTVGFPHPEFWQIAADCGVHAIIGHDIHSIKAMKDTLLYPEAVRVLEKLGIKRVVTLDL